MGGEAMSRCDDYCCNHGCNQGRDCPARKPAKVAKVKARTPAAKPLPPNASRVYLRQLAKWLLIVLAVMTITPAVLSVALAKQPATSKCAGLAAKYRDVPAHLVIKCKGVA